MYISNVKNVIFSLRFFLKEERKIFFQEKKLKKKKAVKIPFSTPSSLFPPPQPLVKRDSTTV